MKDRDLGLGGLTSLHRSLLFHFIAPDQVAAAEAGRGVSAVSFTRCSLPHSVLARLPFLFTKHDGDRRRRNSTAGE